MGNYIRLYTYTNFYNLFAYNLTGITGTQVTRTRLILARNSDELRSHRLIKEACPLNYDTATQHA